jgi:hypothetical protein
MIRRRAARIRNSKSDPGDIMGNKAPVGGKVHPVTGDLPADYGKSPDKAVQVMLQISFIRGPVQPEDYLGCVAGTGVCLQGIVKGMDNPVSPGQVMSGL